MTVDQLAKGVRTLRWAPVFSWQRLSRRLPRTGRVHLILSLADHFEPSMIPDVPAGTYASMDEQERRLEHWCRTYPEAMGAHRDADGYPLRHTYFFPAEQYEKPLIDRLAEHCRAGWGEVEIHLHHGIHEPDTPANTRKALVEFRDILAGHGCLSRWEGTGAPRYAFVHGNWALANSSGGRYCGVDEEMQILAETGCYADLTLPSAPDRSQTTKINSVYECALPLDRRAPHRRGRDLRRGRPAEMFPLIIQGPLALERGARPLVPRIENGELTASRPPTLDRLRVWQRAAIRVHDRPDWVFIKLHCHGMDPRDTPTHLGAPMRQFVRTLSEGIDGGRHTVHFVTAREMTNMLLAACDGCDGDPGQFRDYRLRPAARA